MISKLQEKMNSYQRVWAEIDLDAIWENMIHMKENIAPETKILAVIKTDGYGHGAVMLAREMDEIPTIHLWYNKRDFHEGKPGKESNEYLQHLPKSMQNRKEALG